MMRLILTTIILTMLAQPVWAQKVYYCETTAFAQVSSENEVADIRPYRFKMAVSANSVEFSSADFMDFRFDEVQIRADGNGFFAAENLYGLPVSIGEFDPPQLKVTLMRVTMSAFNAHCEDF